MTKLYKARQAGDRARIEGALGDFSTSVAGRESLVGRILERDAKYGFQTSRRRYLSNTSLQRSGFADEHYSVRIGYELTYPDGHTREETVCRVDPSGRQAAIVEIRFGAFGPAPGDGAKK